MKINVHAGHNPDGMKGCGAVGLLKESTENRKVAQRVIELLQADGHTVYDCTVNDGTSASDVLNKIVKKCNAHTVELDVSIHFNAGAYDTAGNGKTTGTECYIYSDTSKAKDTATRICNKIAELGFKNRGVQVKQNLYVLRKTTAPAVLVECCFVDDADDVKLYDTEKMAAAIASGIVGKALTGQQTTTETSTPVTEKTLDEWAQEVIAGKHGNGHANREASLKAAGCSFSYEEVKAKVNALCGVTTTTQTAYYPKYTGNSYGIDTVFRAIGVPEKYCGNYKNRTQVAVTNGIANYKGTAKQNTSLITLAKQGKLKKA